ncbi:MAG: hypothetical protein RR277_00420 [Rikenellaceae bacterium]
MKLFLITTILLSLLGCRSIKPIVVENFQHDSIYITETVRDSLVKIEQDSSMIRALIECDSMGNAHLKELIEYKAGSRVPPPSLFLANNILTAKAKTDSMGIYLKLKERYSELHRSVQETKIVEVNYLTTWQKFWVKVGKTSAAFGGILLIILITKLWMGKKLKIPF